MTEWAMKRFWTDTSVAETETAFTVHLDGRGVRTPAKSPLSLPTRAFAELVAAEWDAQGEKIDPTVMPFTRLANSAIDNVTVNFDAVAGMLAEYGSSDLICYRAQSPAELVARQQAAWDPLLEWIAGEFAAPLNVGAGIMYVDQPADSTARLARQVRKLTPFQLAAFHDLVTVPGSLVIALAAIHGQASVDDLWAWSRIDEDWQAELWGVDDEAAEHAAAKQREFQTALTAFQRLS